MTHQPTDQQVRDFLAVPSVFCTGFLIRGEFHESVPIVRIGVVDAGMLRASMVCNPQAVAGLISALTKVMEAISRGELMEGTLQ